MNYRIYSLLIIAGVFTLSGCANQARLGQHVNQIRLAQIYNPDATRENVNVIPVGNGEKMQKAYKTYLGEEKQKTPQSQLQTSVSFLVGKE